MTRSKQTPVSEGTREALILAGERLFAELGIDGVSLRQINTATGQRNSSAAHYHFGSKEALIHAIYSYRMERVNRRRLTMLDELLADGEEKNVAAILETIVYPIVEEIHESEGGSNYIRFLAQVMGHPQINLTELWSSRFAAGLAKVMSLLRLALPEVGEPLLGQRFGLMWEQMIHSLADRKQLSSFADSGVSIDRELFVSNLIDTLAGGLSAPVSDTTKRKLRTQKKNHKLSR